MWGPDRSGSSSGKWGTKWGTLVPGLPDDFPRDDLQRVLNEEDHVWTAPSYSIMIEAARRDVARIAVKKFGMSAAEVARHLGVSTTCISQIVAKGTISQTAQETSVSGIHKQYLVTTSSY